jgi:hypothetical protein
VSARFAALLALPLAGCALPTTVQRIVVEYNDAIAGMTNELVLVNILRAKEQLPLHYTALSRASGAVTIKATGGFNASVKADGATNGTSLSTTNQTTNVNSVVNGVTSAITRGGNVFTPSIGGEIDTGPSFDISILNDQKFYQGILTEMPYTTVDNLIVQGFDEELVLRLLINRLTFKLAENNPNFTRRSKGQTIISISSSASGPDAGVIAATLACFDLSKTMSKPDTKVIGTLQRFTHDGHGVVRALDLKDLSLLDGKQFDLSRSIGAPNNDSSINIQRPGQEKVVAQLTLKSETVSSFGPANKPVLRTSRLAQPGECYVPITVAQHDARLMVAQAGKLPVQPPADPVFTAGGTIFVPRDKDGYPIEVKADIEVTFRSTEGVIRFLGDYLRASEADPTATYRIRENPLFSLVRGDVPSPLTSAALLDQRYSVPRDDAGRFDMQVIAIIEQLINLQKSADVGPQTVPVRVIPGG